MKARPLLGASALLLLSVAATRVDAAKLADVGVLDKDYLVVHVLDGVVAHNEGAPDTVTRYTPELDTTAAAQPGSWMLTSADDTNYAGGGRQPVAVYRKKKLSGHAQEQWSGSDYVYEYTYQHWIYLKLPSSLQQGRTYTLRISPATNADQAQASFTFDVYNTRSEAVHVNLVGYAPDAPHKAADLYHWMGDGGARDYSSFEGNTVSVYDVANARAYAIGHVAFWKPSGPDVNWYNLTQSPVWNADFSGFNETGTYRLVIDGVGCSQDFRIATDVYGDPFKVSLRGFFYLRLGQANPGGIVPPPRTPLYIPGQDPANTTVYLTTMQPWDPQWSTFASGDPWDSPDSWAAFRKPGNPSNPNAWGGHADAFDLDRHLGHVSIVYDMLLPYILTHGALKDDNSGIAESGNGIPDVLDEARYEVDFWLRVRDGAGYGSGITNPNGSNVFYQAGPTAIAAWINAANAAMLADAFRLAGRADLMATYRDAAITAFSYASGLADPMLDATDNIGEGVIRGRDLRMTAAAYLYNVTGNPAYEQVVNDESVCNGNPAAELEDGTRNQTWATAGYLMTPQPVHFPALQANMKSSVIYEARLKEAELTDARPSRRATDNRTGYFRTIQNVQRTMIAHAVSDSAEERDYFRKALALEADWSLGRNPLNFIEMTTWTTPLASRRSVEYMYTSGRSDGVPGLDPGHTPYLNLDDWYTGMVMGSPSHLYSGGYPGDFKNTWPIAEGYFNTPWVWAHSEFTPQQTMRGKTALYGYLHALAGGFSPALPQTLTVSTTGNGAVTSSPAGISCGTTCSAAYAAGSTVTLQAAAATGSVFAGWGGACSGTGACTVTMDAAQAVSAAFIVVPTNSRSYGNNGSPWLISATRTTRIEAENYDKGGEGAAYHDTDTSNNGGQYRVSEGVDIESTSDAGGGYNVGWVQPGEWLEYSVYLAAAGTYDVKLRVARQPGGPSAASVWFNGANATGSLVVPSTGAWQSWTDLVAKGVSLAAGPQVLHIAMDGGDFNINWIEITPSGGGGRCTYPGNAGCAWPVSASATTRIEAENYDTGGEGVAYHDVDASNNGGQYRTDGVDIEGAADAGGGYDVGWIEPGEWLEYTVDVAAAGSYDLKLRVARQPGGPSAVSVSVGGVNVTGSLVVPSTGGWQAWTDLVAKGVTLAAGRQVLRINCEGADFNVNWIELAPNLPPVRGTYANGGNPWLIASNGTTRIEAENYDSGGEGVSYHDTDAANDGGQYRSDAVDVEATTDAGGGYDVGWIDSGEWLEYTVSVATAGSYDLKLRVARQPGGNAAVSVLFDGVDKTGSLAVPSTGGWQTWTDVVKSGVPLTAGRHVMRIAMAGSLFNVNWIELTQPATLSVSRTGNGSGTVNSSPAGISCGSDCSETYASGATVTLTATPSSGSAFAGWSGACTGSGPCTLVMNGPQAVTAAFDTATYIYADAVANDWQSWSWGSTIDFGATSPVKDGTNAINVTYDQGWAALSLRKGTALSTEGYAALDFWVYGGSGADKTLGITTNTDDTSGESTRVVVTAPANTWTEITVPISSLGYPYQIKRINIMNFTPDPQTMVTFDDIRLVAVTGPLNTLAVSRTGAGFGSVTSWPPGITCGSDCSEGYSADTTVTLTPSPAAGSRFTGWSGDCTGTGTCTVPTSAARSVTANFDGTTVAGGVRWVGRVDASNPSAVRFAWQGAGFAAVVNGPNVAVNLQTAGAPTAVFQVLVDGLRGARFDVPQGGVASYLLASGLAAGPHLVELYRETEGMYGVSTFSGFTQGTVVGAPASNGRLVEVVGDAVSAGYGDLGSEPHPNWVANPACTWTPDDSSWYVSYGAVAGHALGADVSTVARSGWGLIRDNTGSTANVLPSVYGNAVGTNDPTPWGFSPQASVVIVNLGMGDVALGDPGPAFEAAYVDFVHTIRGRYPNAWIFLTIGSMLGQPNLGIIDAHLANVVATVNDPKVITFDLGQQDYGWNGTTPTGCDWHPSATDHARMAEIIKAQLQSRLGW